MNIILLGNGFDLAHGIKTDYKSFITHVIESHIENKENYSELLKFVLSVSSMNELIQQKFAGIGNKNIIFSKMARSLFKQNWCDIEKLYFSQLISDKANPRNINDDFSHVKNALSLYLTKEEKKAKPLEQYKFFFDNLKGQTIVINFNYTNLYEFYFKDTPIYNIHGQLNSKENEIIFGYAAEDEESDRLILHDDNEYLRNIKKFRYKLSSEYDKLSSILNNQSFNSQLLMFGHSCGLSDRLILKQIFQSSIVEKIRIFYYNNKESYFNTTTNIQRICDKDKGFDKIVNFLESMRMPQHDDTDLMRPTINNMFDRINNDT